MASFFDTFEPRSEYECGAYDVLHFMKYHYNSDVDDLFQKFCLGVDPGLI